MVMKKIFVVCLLAAASVLVYADSEELARYTYLYDNFTPTHETQFALLRDMADKKIQDAGEFYANALRRLNADFKNLSSGTELEFSNKQAILLSDLLAQEKFVQAAGDLWLVVDFFSDAEVQVHALGALGEMHAIAFLPQVIKKLEDLNEKPTEDRLKGQRIALGTIVALEKYKEMEGYLPIYLASKAWYPDGVKEQAKKSLVIISPDPTEYMTGIIRSSRYDYEKKLAALQAIRDSSVSNNSKSSVAFAALDEGWRLSTSDRVFQALLRTMRITAIGMIQSAGGLDNKLYSLLDSSYKQYADRTDGEQTELTQAILALSRIATPEAAKQLSDYLLTLLQRRSLSTKEVTIARELIKALGDTRQSSAKLALDAVVSTNISADLVRRAREALRQLP
jgi:RNase P/RNase MRP subunit POP5